jgi:putative ABC transport system substrate-binding protein
MRVCCRSSDKHPGPNLLCHYQTDFADLYRRAAVYVAKILKRAKPADLAVQWPKNFELVINLKTAKQINVAIPRSKPYRADRVIK